MNDRINRIRQRLRARLPDWREQVRILRRETPEDLQLAIGKRLGLGCAGVLLTLVLAAAGVGWQGWLTFLLLPFGFFALAFHLARACARKQVMALTGTLVRSGRGLSRRGRTFCLISRGQTVRIVWRGRPERRMEEGGRYTLYLLKSTRVRHRNGVYTVAGYVALVPAGASEKGEENS